MSDQFPPNDPAVVATVTSPSDLKHLQRLSADPLAELPDVLEFRLDNLWENLDETERYLASLAGQTEVLITVRRPEEGGALELDEQSRLSAYRRFFDYCSSLDTEVASLQSEATLALASEAADRGIAVIGSFHDFEGCPPIERLEDAVEKAYQAGAVIAKVAASLSGFSDLAVLVELVEKNLRQGRSICAMGMGPLGKLSRLVLAQSGSCLNYGFLQKENAPGQWPAAELKTLIKKLSEH